VGALTAAPPGALAEPPVPGTLTVATRASATVYLDGKVIEHGSFTGRPTENGSHELVVKAPGHAAIRRSISIAAAHETRLDLLPGQRSAAAAAPSQPVAAAKPAAVEPTLEAPAAAGTAVEAAAPAAASLAAPPEPHPDAVAGSVAHGQDPPPAGSEPPRRAERSEPPVTEVVKRPAVDVEATRAAVRSQIGPIQQCYERAKMDDATLKGTVTARITVALDGSIANVQISSSTLSSATAERCIAGEISRWQLPRPSGGAAVSFTYPFVFE
jgi:hypothetical protein